MNLPSLERILPLSHGYESSLSALSMIVNDFDIVSVSVAPDETNPKLVIDADAMLPGSVTLQSLQAVAWRNAQVFQPCGAVESQKFPQCCPPETRGRNAPTLTCLPEPPCILIAKAPNH